MIQESVSIPPTCQPGPALLAATGVLVLGTAWVDPSRLLLLLVPGSFLVLGFGVGALVDRAIGGLLPRLEPLREYPLMFVLALRLGVGLACLSLLTVLAGLCGMLWVVGVVAVPLLSYGLLRCLQDSLKIQLDQGALAVAMGGVVVGAAWLVAWLWATIPPVFFDELEYHLVIPQRALITGELQAIPWVFFTLMPHASDVLMAWGMAFAGDLGARATHFALWLVCSLAAWGLAEAIAWPKPTLLAAPLVTSALAASPTLWFLATLPFAETCLSAAAVTAAAVLVVSQSERRPWLALGLVLGLVATVKLSGMMWVVAGLASTILVRWSRRDILWAGLIVLISVAPWSVRAAVHTGNPIYPMAYGVLGGHPWSEESQARVMAALPYGSGGLGLRNLLRLPLDLVQHPERFGSASDAGALAIVATCLVLVLPAISRLIGVSELTRRLADSAAIFLLVAGTGWVITSPTTRFFGPALVISLTVLAGSLLHLGRKGQAVVMIIMLTAGTWGAWRFVNQHAAVFSSYEVALGRESADDYLARQLDHFAAARFVREKLPTDAKLLFIGETRPYYFSRDAVAPSAYDHHPLKRWVEESSSPEALTVRLAQEGITHVVLNLREFKRLHDSYGLLTFSGAKAEENDRRLKELPRTLRLLFSEKGVYVFKVPHQPQKAQSEG